MSRPPVRVLIAEDEEHLGTILETFLRGRGQAVTRVSDGRAALAAMREDAFDVVLLDVVMPEMDGLEVLRAMATLTAPPEAIVMTGNGTADTAITAMQLRAYDYLAKPYRMAEVDLLVRRAAEKRDLRLALAAGRWRSTGSGVFLTRSPGLRGVLDGLEKSVGAAEDVAGLWVLAGPAGSGRRALARWLHARTGRAHSPPLVVAASGDDDVDERELFGAASRPGDQGLGALEAAPSGMVMVEGWSALSPELRARLAEATLTGQLRRGGAGGTGGAVQLEARLCLCVEDPSTLPAPLMSHASVVATLPPLAGRLEDVAILAEHFLRVSSRGAVRLAASAVEALERQDWPGHVAELRAVVTAGAWRAREGELGCEQLAIGGAAGGARAADARLADPGRATASLAELEGREIAAVLEEEGWHRGRAARRLGISARTLYRRIHQLGLRPGGAAGAGPDRASWGRG